MICNIKELYIPFVPDHEWRVRCIAKMVVALVEPDTVEAILNFCFLILYLKEWRRPSNSNTQAD